MRHRRPIAAAALIAGGLTATACSSSGGAAPAGTAAAAPTPSAQPETAAGAKAAAQRYFGLYAAQQYPAAWGLLAPAVQRAVPEATWAAVHAECPPADPGAAYDVKNVIVTGNTAVATVTLAGAMSALASGSEAFTYAGGRWEYVPAETDLGVYEHGSVAADLAAARAKGYCGTA